MARLQKLLAAAGFGSRRTIEEWIRVARLTVRGRLAQPGDRAGDDIRLDGRQLTLTSPTAPPGPLLYYKPVGEVSAAGPHPGVARRREAAHRRRPPRCLDRRPGPPGRTGIEANGPGGRGVALGVRCPRPGRPAGEGSGP